MIETIRGTPLSAIFAITAVSALPCSAEIPKRSESKLTSSCSHRFSGLVVRTFTTVKQTSPDFEYTYGVAECDVRTVEKGGEIQPGDRLFVRFWRKRWTGEGRPEPSHYGHWDIPTAGDHVTVFVSGDRKTGYDVMSPNGFFAKLPADDGKPKPQNGK